MTLTNDEHVALIKAALAARDRQWEDCLKTLDEKPPLVPDPDWFRTWSERVGLDGNKALESEYEEARVEAVRKFHDDLAWEFKHANEERADEWTYEAITKILKKELDDYNAQE